VTLGVSGGNPGPEHVVGVVGEVVANERVEQVVVVFEVRGRDGYELPIACRGRVRRRARQQQSVTVAGDESGGHEQGRYIAGACPGQDGSDGAPVAADQPAEQHLDLIGHAGSIGAGAYAGLTPN